MLFPFSLRWRPFVSVGVIKKKPISFSSYPRGPESSMCCFSAKPRWGVYIHHLWYCRLFTFVGVVIIDIDGIKWASPLKISLVVGVEFVLNSSHKASKSLNTPEISAWVFNCGHFSRRRAALFIALSLLSFFSVHCSSSLLLLWPSSFNQAKHTTKIQTLQRGICFKCVFQTFSSPFSYHITCSLCIRARWKSRSHSPEMNHQLNQD